MARNLSHGVKRTVSAMMALLIVSSTIPMQPVADVMKSLTLSVSAEGTDVKRAVDLTVETAVDTDIVKVYSDNKFENEILPNADGTFPLSVGDYYILSTCSLEGNDDAVLMYGKAPEGYMSSIYLQIMKSAGDSVTITHKHNYACELSEDKASLDIKCLYELYDSTGTVSFDTENYRAGDTEIGLVYTGSADRAVDNAVISYYDKSGNKTDGISKYGVTTVKADISIGIENFTLETTIAGDTAAAEDFKFNTNEQGYVESMYTGKALTIEDLGLEGTTEAAKDMLADEDTKVTVKAFQSKDHGETFEEAEAKNVGGYKVTVTLENNKYADGPVELDTNCLIFERTLNIVVSMENSANEYTNMVEWGRLADISITVENFAEGESFEDFGIDINDYLSYTNDYDPTDGTKNESGEYTAAVDLSALSQTLFEKTHNYRLHTDAVKFSVRQKDITEDMIHLDREIYKFDGEAHTPVVTVTTPVDKIVDGRKVTEDYILKKGTSADSDIDYYVDAFSNTTATKEGTYYINVYGKGNFFYKFSKQWKIVNDMSVVNRAQVSFGGNFGLHYYFTPSDSIRNDKNAYVKIEKNNKPVQTIKLSDMKSYGDMLTFEYRVVTKEICDNITVKLYDGYDRQVTFSTESGIDCTNKGFVYSVKKYAEAIIAMPSQANYHDLANALIAYGNGAQIGLGYDSPDNPKPSVDADIDLTGLENYTVEKKGENADYGIKQMGPRVAFLDTTTFRVDFVFDKAVDFSDYTVSVDGVKAEAKNSGGAQTSKTWYVEIPGIQGKNYDKEYEVTLTKDGVETPLTLKASVLSYAKLLTEQSSEKYQTLGKVMYNYYKAEAKTFNRS